MLDGAPNLPHTSGGPAIRTGRALTAEGGLPGESFDVTIGDRIGTRTRFRSLETSASGDPRNSLSGRGGGNLNPSEGSAAGLYRRLFGTGFKDPNGATFTPDPEVMARRSVLSAVSEQRQSLESAVGAADRQKLDQYFTSVRQLENQLEVELKKPEPLQACLVPKPVEDRPVNAEIENVVTNHALMTDLLVMALACDQTRVFNMMFDNGASSLTRIGSTITHHQLTHEEALDNRLGYQPEATYFLSRIFEAWTYFVAALDKVQEGPRTLLDNTLVFAHSETEFAKFHTIDNIPMMTAGSGGGRIRTGIYVDGLGSPVSRVGLTLQQVMGCPWTSGGEEHGDRQVDRRDRRMKGASIMLAASVLLAAQAAQAGEPAALPRAAGGHGPQRSGDRTRTGVLRERIRAQGRHDARSRHPARIHAAVLGGPGRSRAHHRA